MDGAGRLNTNAAIVGLVLLVTVLLFPAVLAVTPSGMGYVGVHTPGQNYEDNTRSVALSPDDSLLASGTDDYIVITNMSDRTVVGVIDVDDIPTVLKFTPDGAYLVVGTFSSTLQSPAIRVIETEGWGDTGYEFANGRNPHSLAISADGSRMLLKDQNKGVFELTLPELQLVGHLNNGHLDEVSCVDYDVDGAMGMTGGMDGKVILWDMSEHTMISTLTLDGDEVWDCALNPSGTAFSVLTTDGRLRTYYLNGTLVAGSQIEFFEAIGIQWSHDGDHLLVLETFILPSLQRIRALDWIVVEVTKIGHNVLDFDVSRDGETLVTSTGTIHIGIYKSNYQPPGFGIEGYDLDQDGVPDDIDPDDDGDGILDLYDIHCDEGLCSEQADLDFIRSIEIEVTPELLEIRDSVTFTRFDSSALRNLTSTLLVNDRLITVEEVSQMSTAMCDNILVKDVIDQWRYQISIEGTQLDEGTMRCDSVEGMSVASLDSYSMRATFTWTTSFSLLGTPVAPYNITIRGVTLAPTGSSAVIAPQFPVAIKFVDSNAIDTSIAQWQRDDSLTVVLMDAIPPDAPGVEDLVTEFIMSNLWIPISTFAFLFLGGALIVKQQKDILKGLNEPRSDDDHPEDEHPSTEEDYEEYFEEQPVEQQVPEDEGYEQWSTETDQWPPKPSRGPPRVSTRRASTEEYTASQTPLRARKKRVSTDLPSTTQAASEVVPEEQQEDFDYGIDAVYHDPSWETEYGHVEVSTKVRKVRNAEQDSEKETKKRRKAKRKGGRRKAKRRSPKTKSPETPLARKQPLPKVTEQVDSRPTKKVVKTEDDEKEESAMDKALGMLPWSKMDDEKAP